AAGIRIIQGPARKGADDRVVAALKQPQLVAPAHLVAEAHASRALDAALGVERHALADVVAFRPVDLLLVEATEPLAVGRFVRLQPALPRLIADRAVERVVDQQELLDAGARLFHPRVPGPYHHPLGGRGGAGDLQL